MKKINQGLSLIELLVVVGVIGILSGVGVYFYQGYIEKAKRTVWLKLYDTVESELNMLLLQCSTNGSAKMINSTGNEINVSCKSFSRSFANYFETHVNETICPKNVYDESRTKCMYHTGGYAEPGYITMDSNPGPKHPCRGKMLSLNILDHPDTGGKLVKGGYYWARTWCSKSNENFASY